MGFRNNRGKEFWLTVPWTQTQHDSPSSRWLADRQSLVPKHPLSIFLHSRVPLCVRRWTHSNSHCSLFRIISQNFQPKSIGNLIKVWTGVSSPQVLPHGVLVPKEVHRRPVDEPKDFLHSANPRFCCEQVFPLPTELQEVACSNDGFRR